MLLFFFSRLGQVMEVAGEVGGEGRRKLGKEGCTWTNTLFYTVDGVWANIPALRSEKEWNNVKKINPFSEDPRAK